MFLVAGFVLLPVLMLKLLRFVEQGPSLSDDWRVGSAEVFLDVGSTPPGPTANGERVELPVYRATPGGEYSSAWFRLSAERRDVGDQVWAYYAPVVLGNMAVSVNEVSVGSGGRTEPPLADHRAPLYFEFPSQVVTTGSNTIDVYFVRPHPSVALSPIYFGPADELLPAAKSARFFRLWVQLAIIMGMIVVAVIIGCLALLRRQEPTYAWYTVALLFWALHHAHDLVARIPIDYWTWQSLSYSSLGLFVFAAYIFVNRFTGIDAHRMEKVLGLWVIAGSVALVPIAVFQGNVVVDIAGAVWVPSILLIGALLVVALIRGVIAVPDGERIALLCVSNTVLVVGIRDYLWEQFGDITDSTYYLAYTAGIVLIVFSVILMKRFAGALQQSELMSEELEERVREKHRQLEDHFSRLKELEAENAKVKERERIMQDVHDGLGGHLLQLLSRAEDDPTLRQLEPDIRAAMQDLRLIVDSLSPNDGDLVSVLAMFRHRIQPLIERNGLKFEWRVADLPALPDIGPEETLNVLRILQEAVTNIIHHANASRITVETRMADDGIELSISDDGCGFDTAVPQGHGLANMRRRARVINGRIDITSDERGTTIQIFLPQGKS